ncbi:MAG: integrin alpha [Thioalkalispiraceae bacterium]|jgi:hypothetical protein
MFPSTSTITSLLPFFLAGLLLSGGCTRTFSSQVDSSQKINESEGNFNSLLADNDRFGSSIANIGDLNGDDIVDLAVSEPFDDDGGTDRGAVWILFMGDNGEVINESKISSTEGNFSGSLDDNDKFGGSVDVVGDLNNDGVNDIVVGAQGDDEGGTERGAIWILFLNSDGTVQSQRKIANSLSGLGDVLNDNDQFGSSLANIGDLNNDGINELAVGVPFDDDGGTDFGAVWILFLDSSGAVTFRQKISFEQGGFAGDLFTNDRFGSSITAVGDLDSDGIADLAIGVPGDDDGGTDRGAVWLLYMNSNGTVKDEVKISQTAGEFDGTLNNGDGFGNAVANLGDYNNDGVPELGVGAKLNDDGGPDRGAFWVLFLKQNGNVISSSKISDLEGNFAGTLNDGDQFASGLVSLGDLDNDGNVDIAVTASGDSVNGPQRGAVWILFMAPVKLGVRVDKDTDLAKLFAGS